MWRESEISYLTLSTLLKKFVLCQIVSLSHDLTENQKIKMKKYKYLALTDHSGHSKENSLYALMRTLSKHDKTHSVSVASRGDIRNEPFFNEVENSELYITSVNENFEYESDGQQFTNSETKKSIADFDVIIMRLPRPVSDEFLDFLTQEAKGKVIINHPHGIRKTSTKQYLLHFPQVCPEMKMVRSAKEVKAFAEHFPIVLKPLREYGGKGIVKIEKGKVHHGDEVHSLEEYLSIIKIELELDGYLAMKFLKNVTAGDKRILVVDGQILASSLRLPAEDSWLCNVAQGGKSVPSEADADEIAIINKITPFLKQEGILMFGADTLVDDNGKRVLSEVNTLSIGGFPQAEKQTGRPILQQTIDLITKYVEAEQKKPFNG